MPCDQVPDESINFKINLGPQDNPILFDIYQENLLIPGKQIGKDENFCYVAFKENKNTFGQKYEDLGNIWYLGTPFLS